MKNCLSKSPNLVSASPQPLRRSSTELSLKAPRHQILSHSSSSSHSISIKMLENYFKDLISTISSTNKIPESINSKLPTIRNILNDCMALSHISLEFYCQVDACLNLISKTFLFCESTTPSELLNLVKNICKMINSHEYIAKNISIPFRGTNGNSIEKYQSELQVRIGRITPRVINVWRRVISNNNKDIDTICYGILKFYSEVDMVIKKLTLEEPKGAMHLYCKNPGHVVQVLRKTFVYLNGEMISLRIIREVNEILQKISPEIVSCIDKTMSGFVLWDLIRYSIEYYRAYGYYHYRLDIFDKNLVIDETFTNAKDIFKHSVKAVPINAIGEISVIYKLNCKAQIKSVNNSGCKENLKVVKKCSDTEDVECYEGYVGERFKEFLMEKIKDYKDIGQEYLKEKKNEILEEFNRYMEIMDSEKIRILWDEKNLAFEASKLA